MVQIVVYVGNTEKSMQNHKKSPNVLKIKKKHPEQINKKCTFLSFSGFCFRFLILLVIFDDFFSISFINHYLDHEIDSGVSKIGFGLIFCFYGTWFHGKWSYLAPVQLYFSAGTMVPWYHGTMVPAEK